MSEITKDDRRRVVALFGTIEVAQKEIETLNAKLMTAERRVSLLEWICGNCSIQTPIDGRPLIHDEGSLETIRGMSGAAPLAAGDWATHPDWGGTSLQIEEIRAVNGTELLAFFVQGGFWRVSQLVRAETPNA